MLRLSPNATKIKGKIVFDFQTWKLFFWPHWKVQKVKIYVAFKASIFIFFRHVQLTETETPFFADLCRVTGKIVHRKISSFLHTWILVLQQIQIQVVF